MNRKSIAMLGACALAAASAAPAQAAAYLPTGVQLNVATSTVTGGGWTQCYSSAYGTFGGSISSILAGCQGSNLMMAARETGSSTLLLLAQASFADVTFDTGTGNVTHNANGVEWYFNNSYSWGFAPGGSTVIRNSCDIVASANSGTAGAPTGTERLCWHTGSGQMNGGWRAGAATSLNNSSAYEKVLFSFSGVAAVPEPSTWAMMIVGLGLLGFSLRRNKASAQRTTVSYA